ncbi:MAG: GNAT family N-acetyltransferase [Lachnospiraceae bacterium]|nr:GNAT family N-acetyltransferase [Lachnospiraceae bacterium]
MEKSYHIFSEAEIVRSLFQGFLRYQEVRKCWQKGPEGWELKNVSYYIEDWNDAQYEFLVKCLKNTVVTGGFVFGVFEGSRMIGFASVESRRFGSGGQYVQLSCIHVSWESRGKGLGRGLFQCVCSAARKLGAEKLYISAHPSQETQTFYHRLGCVEAKEYNEEIAAAEPGDCQLEYNLK